MNKLQKVFSKMSELLKEIYIKFPCTILIVYIITLMFVFGTDDFIDKVIDEYWINFLVISAIGTLFVESLFVDKKKKVLGNVVSVIIALGFKNLFEADVSVQNYFVKLFTAYVIVLPLFTIYINLKKSNLTFNEYALRVISNFGKTFSMYILANIGILIVLAVFIELILDGEDYDLYSKILILLLGGFYVPALIDTISNVKNEAGKFLKVLITYILTPVVSFLVAILYLYILKITIEGELLKDSIFYILAITFSFGMPCTVLLQKYKENEKLYKLSKVFLYSFIPLIILQIIAMNIRVSDYGLTDIRYMGYLFIILEIFAIILMLVKESKNIDKIILVFAGLVLIGTITPFNIQDVPAMSQVARIKSIVSNAEDFDKLSVKEKNECKYAYRYVMNIKEGYVNKKLDSNLVLKLENYIPVSLEDNKPEKHYRYISVYRNINDGLNVEGYKKVYIIDNHYIEDDNGDYSQMIIESRDSKILVTANIEKIIDEMINAELMNKEYEKFEEIRLMDTNNENIKIYLTSMYMDYDVYSKEVDDINFDGYLLVK